MSASLGDVVRAVPGSLTGPNMAYIGFVVLIALDKVQVTAGQFIWVTIVFVVLAVVEGHFLRPLLNEWGEGLGKHLAERKK